MRRDRVNQIEVPGDSEKARIFELSHESPSRRRRRPSRMQCCIRIVIVTFKPTLFQSLSLLFKIFNLLGVFGIQSVVP